MARFASNAREIVSLVAWAAAVSRCTLPVSTDWLVTRNVSALDTLCWAEARPAQAQKAVTRIRALDRLLRILGDLDLCREDTEVRLSGSVHLDGVADRDVLAPAVAVVGVLVSDDEAGAGSEPDVRARSRQRRQDSGNGYG